MANIDAETYFSNRPNSELWQGSTEEEKSGAVEHALRQLKPYRGRIPTAMFYDAVCEQAIWLLRGSKRAGLQQDGVTGFSIGGLSEQFDLRGRPAYIAPQAWAMLRGGGTVRMGALR